MDRARWAVGIVTQHLAARVFRSYRWADTRATL